MDALARWRELMRLPEASVPLDEAALTISARANPALDVTAQLRRLDALARLVAPGDASSLCHVLFQDIGLQGDRDHYDDPVNSYLDQVLDRGRGIPISLSILLLEIGRRCGVPLEPVGMPGHFLVRDASQPDSYIDAFDGGRRLDLEACERLLQSVTGRPARLTPDLLAATSPWAVVARMLANLDGSFDRRQDHASLAWVSEMRAEIPAAAIGDRVQLARRMSSLGRFDAAAALLDQVAEESMGAEARGQAQREAVSLRARLN